MRTLLYLALATAPLLLAVGSAHAVELQAVAVQAAPPAPLTCAQAGCIAARDACTAANQGGIINGGLSGGIIGLQLGFLTATDCYTPYITCISQNCSQCLDPTQNTTLGTCLAAIPGQCNTQCTFTGWAYDSSRGGFYSYRYVDATCYNLCATVGRLGCTSYSALDPCVSAN